MDLRGQEHKRIVMPSSFVYGTSFRELNPKRPSHPSLFSTLDQPRDGTFVGYGAAVTSSSQVFDDHNVGRIFQQSQPPIQQQQQQQQQVSAVPHPQPEPQLQQTAQPESPPPQSAPTRASHPDPEPQPEPVSIAIPSVTSTAPIGIGSNHSNPTSLNDGVSIRYHECLKNHAANTGGHVIDGCGEFMPGGEEGSPEALKCAACQCHRNFHRREADGELHSGANYYRCYNPNGKANGSGSRIQRQPPLLLPALPQPTQQHRRVPIGLPTAPPSDLVKNFGHGGGDGPAGMDSSSEELHKNHTNVTAPEQLPQPPYHRSSLSNKRFRTKFTNEQKEKMLDFAEKVGWRMPKQDEAAVEHFCVEVGVKRQVFKVWMHNNKHTMKKKEL